MDRIIGNWKKTQAATKKAKLKTVTARRTTEDDHKKAVRRRDRWHCRFPLCGCERLRLRLECSHDIHKGMGGNPKGDRSQANVMTLLCVHRHQEGKVSRHAGSMRTRYLTKDKADGPVVFELKTSVLRKVFPGFKEEWLDAYGLEDKLPVWWEIARERSPQHLEPLTAFRETVLRRLAEMDV